MMNRFIVTAMLASVFWMSSAKKIETAKWEQPKYENVDSIYILDYHYNSNAKLFYMISNDSHNLYVRAKVIDVGAQKKFLMNGFTVWVDDRAKGKKEVGVKYPLAPDNKMEHKKERPSGGKFNGEKPDFIKMRTNLISGFRDLELINFPEKPEVVFVSELDQNPVKGKITVNEEGVVYYLLKIPFESIGLDYEPSKLISVSLVGGVVSGGASNRESGVSSARMGGEQSGGMGGGRSGGMGGPPGGGGGGRSDVGGGMPGGGPQSQVQQSPSIKINIKHLQLL